MTPGTEPVLIVSGSPRANGNTGQMVKHMAALLGDGTVHVDLATQRIEPFRYQPDADDDFRPLIEQILAHRHVVLATPVYWYAMSGLMKTLFDRLTDLLLDAESRKLGRALAGRELWVLATGTDAELPEGFETPFARTAAYFDILWQGVHYLQAPRDGGPLPEQTLAQLAPLAAELRSRA